MECRSALKKDAKGVAAVLAACYNMDEKEAAETFKEETERGHQFIIATEREKVIGIVTWLSHGRPKHGLAELDRIAVLDKYRGKGVAKELFSALVTNAMDWYNKHDSAFRKLYLLTHDDNKRAHAFYEKMGFSHETTLKDHYYKDMPERMYSIFF